MRKSVRKDESVHNILYDLFMFFHYKFAFLLLGGNCLGVLLPELWWSHKGNCRKNLLTNIQFKRRCIYLVLSFWLMTFLRLVLSLCGSAAAGYQIPLTFQMDEWEHEWVEEDKRRVTRHLKVGSRPCVCVGVLCELVTRSSWRKRWSDKNPVGTNRLSVGTGWYCFTGCGRKRGKGVKPHTGPAPSFLEFTCLSTQTLNLQKRI